MSDRTQIKINRNLARWVLLVVGILGLITALIAWIALGAAGEKTVAYVALGVGILGIAGFVLVDPESLAASITGRTGQQATISLLMTIFFIAAIGAGYYIVYRLSDQGTLKPVVEPDKYKISQVTIDMLKELKEPVHVTAFYPQTDAQGREEARTWLQHYKQYAGDKFTFEFVDPDLNPSKATELGVTSPGTMVFQQGERKADASFPDESTLTGALAKVQLGEQQKAYVITGHGERSTEDFASTGYSDAKSLMDRANYAVETLDLRQTQTVPDDADLVIIAGPTGRYSEGEVQALDDYLNRGGAVLLLYGATPGQGGGTLGNGVMDVAYSPDGKLLATAGADGTAKIWNAVGGGDTERLTLRGHTNEVISVAFSPDGKRLVTGSRDGTVRIWDAQSGEQVGDPLTGETTAIQRVAWSPDGKIIAGIGQNQVINLWDASSLEPLSFSPIATTRPLFGLAFSPDGSLLAVSGGSTQGTPEGNVFVFDTSSGEQVAEARQSNLVYSVAFTPDGSEVKGAGVDGTLSTLNIESGESSSVSLYEASKGILSVAVTPDGSNIILGLLDGTVHIHPADSSSASGDTVLESHKAEVWAVAVSPDGKQIASASRDGTAKIWEMDKTDAPKFTFTGHAAVDPLINYVADKWGVQLLDGLVIDQVSEQAFQTAEKPIVITYQSSSPITESLNKKQTPTFFPLARGAQTVTPPPENVTLTPILVTVDQPGANPPVSWVESDPFSQQLSFDPATDTPGPVTIGVSAETPDKGRLVVIGDSDFISNDSLARTDFGNGELFTNTLNWLAQAESSVTIPPANISQATWDRPFSTPALIVTEIALACLLPLLFLVTGAVVWAIRRRRR